MKSVLQLQKEGWARVIERRGCTATVVESGETIRGALRPRKEDPVALYAEGSSNVLSPNRYVFTSVSKPLPETGDVTFSAFPGDRFTVVDVDVVSDGEEPVFYRATLLLEADV